ncbi:large conductance mechanosensitive channel protein [Synechococcus sp. PCC 7502]|uniref:large conductance mechanosensitive channel protein MscL n=1 Tax=Synechococcus sp. PCC 7502 TaxID=1173263 RepID=UPI00029FA351|nr:large conductance mechanosensitive channel protein MscL [Synechococcus sp. PCC 7502]AFY73377.1 large conductance mechanosensitive channel protein [Synechococcus sp. PCC 7502]
MPRSRATSLIKEFKDFALKGNVIDLAVAVIIGGAFGKIVESFIADIITPLLLKPALEAAKVQDLASLSLGGVLYGKFLAATLNFIVIAFVIFILIKAIAATKRKALREEAQAAAEVIPEPTEQERLIASLDRLVNVLERQAVNHETQAVSQSIDVLNNEPEDE